MPFLGAEQDPGSKQDQVRAKVCPISRHIPGSRQQMVAGRAEDQGKHIVTLLLLLPNILVICSQGTSLLLPPSELSLRHHCCQAKANSVLSEQAEGEGSLSVF